MVDLDHFKRVNDAHGHMVGDSVLQSIANAMEGAIRNSDYIARYGGDEFVVILPETPLPKAEEMAERLLVKVAKHPTSILEGTILSLTHSIGVANFPAHGRTWQDLLKAADVALHSAKKAGRNCVKTGNYNK